MGYLSLVDRNDDGRCCPETELPSRDRNDGNQDWHVAFRGKVNVTIMGSESGVVTGVS